MRRNLLALGAFGSRSRLRGRIEALLAHGRVFFPSASLARAAASAAVLLALAIAASFAPRFVAFAQRDPRPSFDVASVKANKSGSGLAGLRPDPGRLSVTNLPLKAIIEWAYGYGMDDYRISGGPGWIESERFDIEGAAPNPMATEQLRLMLQALLEDRFKLAARRETKELPVFSLVIAKNGPRLVQSPPGADRAQGGAFIRGFRITGQAATMQQLANVLSSVLHRPVRDETGLSGSYDFDTKEFAADQDVSANLYKDLPPDLAARIPQPPASAPSIFTALEEQLGLKLESSKGPVEVLVIDHVERPSGN
jgi:uncharacterized protein (TIGR03435 family)